MTALNIPALREAVAKMTEGPWFWKPGSLRDIITASDTADTRVCEAAPGNTNGEDDTKGIVALRNAAPALLDEVEAARAVLETSEIAWFFAKWPASKKSDQVAMLVDRAAWQAWQARREP